ncbi:hypothetical protein [Halopenitus sp. POP-27]|uniref:hypothetical protein n=1 Tax=Halopenitus sp. POP-27 TaxID=2994425 RepID=UPI002469B5F6|nr:hypothetical protein [Halopenitus sp. POP-27]
MVFLANRANLDKRTLLGRLHNQLRTQVPAADSPIEQVWYHTSSGNKVGVRAALSPSGFLGQSYPIDTVELQVSFDFPATAEHDYYAIQWIESERDLLIGWHQDETHPDLGPCHFQIDHRDETIQRATATFRDEHPLNVFDQRLDDLVVLLNALEWTDGQPSVPDEAIR